MKTVGIIALATACLFMAGLNLWNKFKDWFDKNYQKRTGYKQDEKVHSDEKGKDRDISSSVIGKSKFNLREEELKREQRQAEQARKIAEMAEKAEMVQNKAVFSMDLEKEPNPLSGYEGPVSSEEDIILYAGYTKEDAALENGQAATVDEFNLLTKSLQGNPVSADERNQVPDILQRVQGTDLYHRFIKQVDGAESRAAAILQEADDLEENKGSTSVSNNLSRFIRT